MFVRGRVIGTCAAGAALLTGTSAALSSGASTGALAEAATEQAKQPTLEVVQVVFRHGARTPLGALYWPELVDKWDVCGKAYDPVPLDIRMEDGTPRRPNPDDVKQVNTRYDGNCSKGELTLEGQEQALKYGRWLRRRYVDELGYLPPQFAPGAVLPRTTNYSRTVATLAGVLTGLYPGDKTPIPTLTTPEMDELLYANVRSCGRLKALVKDLHREHKEQHGQSPEVQALGTQVARAMALPDDHKISWLSLHDALTSMQAHDKPIPEGMKERPDLLLQVDKLAVEGFLHVVAPPATTGKQELVLRLGMGRLIKMLAQRMDEAAHGQAGYKMYMYSGHDSTIMPLLVALGKEVESWPAYMSNLVFENWRTPDGDRYVKVLYNGEHLGLEELCGVPDCPLDIFRQAVLRPLALTEGGYEEECVVHPKHTDPAGERVEAHARGDVSIGSSMQEDDD